MKKIFISLALLAMFLQIDAATPQPQQAKPQNHAAKSYTFTEELVDIPIKPFDVQKKLSDSELLDIDPQALKAYEKAVSIEKWPAVLKTPLKAGKAWNEVAKITQRNPFLNIAKARLEEWRSYLEIFNKHGESVEKLKTLLASSLLADEQKKIIVSKHLDDFGITFGTQEVLDLTKNISSLSEFLKSPGFQTKIQEIKQKRCEKNSGKDCYECGKEYASQEYEKLTLFVKACQLKYKPGCDEENKIKVAQEAAKAKIAAEAKRKEEKITKTVYNLKEMPLNLIKPFAPVEISDQDILSTDLTVLKKFEAAASKEKEKISVRAPGPMSTLWKEVAKITKQNPFAEIAKERASQWRECTVKMYKQDEELNLIKRTPSNEQKISYALKYLDEYGVVFGTAEIENTLDMLSGNSSEISSNKVLKAKIKDVKKQRCDLNSVDDCYSLALNYAGNNEEKTLYLKKSCYLGNKQACNSNSNTRQIPAK